MALHSLNNHVQHRGSSRESIPALRLFRSSISTDQITAFWWHTLLIFLRGAVLKQCVAGGFDMYKLKKVSYLEAPFVGRYPRSRVPQDMVLDRVQVSIAAERS